MLWKSPYLLLVLATILWGGNFVVGKVIVADIPPVTLAFIRWTIAMAVVLVLFGRSAWANRKLFVQRWRTVLLLTLTGVVGFNTFTYIAVQYTDSINASLMNAAAPILIVAISTIVLSERFLPIRLLGILISMIGVLWIISRGSWSAVVGLHFNQGDLWMLLAVFLWSVYSVAVKKVAGVFPPNEIFTVTVVLCVLILAPCAAVEWAVKGVVPHVSAKLAGGVFYVGIFASVVAFSSWNKAVSILGPARCASFLNLIPLFSAIFATAFVGERIQLYHLIGALFVLGGVYLTARGKSKDVLPPPSRSAVPDAAQL